MYDETPTGVLHRYLEMKEEAKLMMESNARFVEAHCGHIDFPTRQEAEDLKKRLHDACKKTANAIWHISLILPPLSPRGI